MKYLWSVLVASLSLIHCKTPTYAPDSYEGRSITFGSGGGVTGHVSCTAILETGHFYQGTGLANIDFQAAGRLNAAQSEQLFDNYETLGLADISHDVPGNTYRFIEYKQKGKTHRITWGAKEDLPDPKVHTFYQILKFKTDQQ